MNYWPNVDAVAWFAAEILPPLRQRTPDTRFYIVGANPDATVAALARLPGVAVTGRVPDVRPYVAHAAVAVAPLRVAGGIQNKVLEGMAMARPVVASPRALQGLEPEAARHVRIAPDASSFVAQVAAAIAAGGSDGAASRARQCVLDLYDWRRNLSALLPLLAPSSAPAAGSAKVLAAL